MNIRDIARMAGVSVTTVSRVLNGHPYVSDSKKEAVHKAMELADYERNINAVHLSRGKTHLIGVMVPTITRPYFGMVIEGIAEEALKGNCKLVLIQTNYEEEREEEALQMLKLKQIDALIICSKSLSWEKIEEYAPYGPIVVQEDARGRRVSSVYIDHYQAFTKALEFLRERGHRRVGYCLARRQSPNSRLRESAYRDFYSAAGVIPPDHYAFYDCYDMEDGERIMHQLLAMEKPPTALLVTGDQVAAGILTFCREHQIAVPEQLALVGFDNQPIARIMHITTLDIPLTEIGRRLFRQAAAGGHTHDEIPVTLIERSTV